MSVHEALDRIAAFHRPKSGAHYRAENDTWEEYVICDYDKTEWPCRTQQILDQEL